MAKKDLPLAYRAMTDYDPDRLWERIKQAVTEGYVPVSVQGIGTQELLDPVEKTTLFMRLVIDPVRVKRHSQVGLMYENTIMVSGDTSVAFCSKVSNLVVNDGWKIWGLPRLFFYNGKPALKQLLHL